MQIDELIVGQTQEKSNAEQEIIKLAKQTKQRLHMLLMDYIGHKEKINFLSSHQKKMQRQVMMLQL